MKYILMMQLPLSEWKTSRIELWPPQDIKAHFDFEHAHRGASGDDACLERRCVT
jgi:hypothetical protein